MRTEFSLEPGKEVHSASAYVSGAGCFSLTVNGVRATDAFLEPSWANLPPTRMLYRAYDIKPLMLLSQAEAPEAQRNESFARGKEVTTVKNALGIRLGMCKYGYLGGFCDGAHGATAACKAAILQLAIKYKDGSVQNISSHRGNGNGNGWIQTTAANPIRFSHLCVLRLFQVPQTARVLIVHCENIDETHIHVYLSSLLTFMSSGTGAFNDLVGLLCLQIPW
eukprot:SAG31_NODE_300_length_18109_cov_47.887285_13_plen_222_part_00